MLETKFDSNRVRGFFMEMETSKKIELFEQLHQEFPNIQYNHDGHYRNKAEVIIRNIFGEDSPQMRNFKNTDHFVCATKHSTEEDFRDQWRSGINQLNDLLLDLKDEIQFELYIKAETHTCENQQDGALEMLEHNLCEAIYDFILKNPTFTYTGNRNIPLQRTIHIKQRDHLQGQLCGQIFQIEDLEVDHIPPFSFME